jgi:hypothetical protein
MKKITTAAAVLAVPLFAACSAGPAAPSGSAPSFPAPQSAAQVARQAGATGFTDCGAAPAGGVTDAGTAYMDGKRMGIATFPSSGQRDTWLQTVASFGIVPSQEGATWVLYIATDQAAKGCG